MAEQRLPIVNSDDGTWGDILRQYLMKEHYNGDTDLTQATSTNGGHQFVTIRPGTTSAAPLTLSSGSLRTVPAIGSIEFNGDSLYFTQTTGTTRKKVATYDDSSGAQGDLYYRDNSGYFTPLPIGSSGKVLTVAGGLPSWQTPAVSAANLTGTTAQFNAALSDNDFATLAGNEVLSGKTLTSPKVNELTDTNGTKILTLTPTASAVNYLDLKNNIAGFSPTITATGASSTIHINLIPKGAAGRITENGVEVTTISRVQTFTNKTLDNTNTATLKDTNFTLQDDGDVTKQAKFDASAITAGQTRTYALPDADTTLVGTGTVQTLTGKTLTAPLINQVKDTTGNVQFDTSPTDMSMSVDLNMQGNYVWNLPTPVDPGDAVTKSYFDTNAVTTSGAQTLTNKRIQPRSASITSSATPSINSDNVDTYQITALATNVTSVTVTGTPVVGQQLLISIKDDGSSRTVAWGSSFVSTGIGTLPTATVSGKTHWIGVVWDGSKWSCLAADAVGY